MVIEKYDPAGGVCRIPGICTTASGAVLLVYECRSGRSDWAEINIALRRSDDGGKTFSGRQIIVPGNGKTVNNPVLIADEDRVLLLWQEEYFRTFMAESRDDGRTFTGNTELTDQLRKVNFDYTVIACGPGHGVRFGKEKYAVPLWMAKNKDPHAHHPSVFSVMCSEDGGKHWKIADVLADDALPDPSEASAVVRKDGRLLLNIRNESPVRRRYLSLFDPDGMRFEPLGFCDTLPDPVCYAGTVSDGETICYSGCDSTRDRIALTVKRSLDGGKTYIPFRTVSAAGGYSDLALSPDGRELYIFYEKEEDDRMELCFDRFTL